MSRRYTTPCALTAHRADAETSPLPHSASTHHWCLCWSCEQGDDPSLPGNILDDRLVMLGILSIIRRTRGGGELSFIDQGISFARLMAKWCSLRWWRQWYIVSLRRWRTRREYNNIPSNNLRLRCHASPSAQLWLKVGRGCAHWDQLLLARLDRISETTQERYAFCWKYSERMDYFYQGS